MENSYLEVAIDIAKQAGEVLLKYFGKDKEKNIDLKGPKNLVTQADLDSELLIVSLLSKYFPNHGILGEEKTNIQGESDFHWFIDPLDGTTNFAHDHPFFSISMGMSYQNRMEVGVVYAPYLGELFYAERGKGAFLVKGGETSQIYVSKIDDLKNSLLATGFAYHEGDSFKNMENFSQVLKLTHGIRRCGSAALDLSYVACGRYDGYWELGLYPYDVAAGSLLVEEARGMVSDWNYGKEYLFGNNIIASNGMIHSQIRENLSDFPIELWGTRT